MLAGSLAQGNIFAGDACGTGTASGVALSITATVIWWCVTLALIKFFLKKAKKDKETFLSDGKAIKNSDFGPSAAEEELPSVFASLLPLVIVIASAMTGMTVVKALCLGCAASALLFYKRLKGGLVKSLSAGMSDCYSAALSVAALNGFGSVIKILPAFQSFSSMLGALPGFLGSPAAKKHPEQVAS